MSRLWLSSRSGFTLIEALVVMGVIGVMILISAPAFVGQQASSQDAEARRYLEQAYRLARSQTIDAGGKYGTAGMTDAGALTAAINLAYPEYVAEETATAPATFREISQPTRVKLAVFITDPSPPSVKVLKLRIRSESDKICVLSSDNQALPTIKCTA